LYPPHYVQKGIMIIDLDTAVRTLVCTTMAQAPSKRVTSRLIVAVLARKFSDVSEEHIARLVSRTIIEEGGSEDVHSTTGTAPPSCGSPDRLRRISGSF
jgi:hypothetical protein